jgi:hypothetical protein
MAWLGVDQLIPSLSPSALIRRDFFFPITLFPRRLVLVLSALCGMFTSGPQSQPIKFQSQSQISLHSTSLSVNILWSFLVSFTTLVSPVGLHILPKLSTKTVAIGFPRTRVYFASFFLVSIGSPTVSSNDTLHAFASRTGKSPTFWTSYKLERRSFKVVQKSDHGRLTYLRKPKCPSPPAVTASIHYIGRPSSATLLI